MPQQLALTLEKRLRTAVCHLEILEEESRIQICFKSEGETWVARLLIYGPSVNLLVLAFRTVNPASGASS